MCVCVFLVRSQSVVPEPDLVSDAGRLRGQEKRGHYGDHHQCMTHMHTLPKMSFKSHTTRSH